MHTHREFRDQAHRPAPERLRPVEVVAFIVLLAAALVGLALFLATGPAPA